MRALKTKLKVAGAPARRAAALPQDVLETLARARALAIAHVRKLDESDPSAWARIIYLVRQVGLTKETLCRELSCAWSTVLRWEAGQTVPGPFARKAIKEKLVEVLAGKPDARATDPGRKRVRIVRPAVARA